MKTGQRIPLELIFWITGIGLLAWVTPGVGHSQEHITLCPIANIGVDWCPGCGIGRSIGQLLHGNIAASVQQHWFGIPALLILIYRVFILMRLQLAIGRNIILKRKGER